MNRYLKGALGFARGFLFALFSKWDKNRDIDCLTGIFPGADLEFDRGSRVAVGKNVRIRERASLKVRRGASLVLKDNVYVGPGSIIAARSSISVGEGTLVSPYVLIYDHDHKTSGGVPREKEYVCSPVTIGKNCWIGAHTVILKGSVLGDNCVVGAGSVIKGEYPAGSRIIQKRTEL